ncbi:MAG TPA: type II secretion system secretin GspD, partial [Gammaproteobacteria bacterium]
SMTLNLKDADINAVISTVAEMTGKNFIVDPRVKGKVTVISARPMNADEIYQVFLSVLSVNGFAAIPGRNAIKIVPEVDAKQDAVRTTSDESPGRGDEYVTRVIQVNNIAAAQLVPVVRPLLPQEAHLAAYPDTNVLVVSAPAATTERLAQIVRRIDTANNSDVEVIRLNHASAEEVARILTTVANDPAKGAQQGAAAQAKIIADARTNTVLLSADQATRLRLKAIITHLDLPLEQSGNSRVIYLRYANAKDLVPVLTGVSNGMAADAKKAGGTAPGTDTKTVIEAHEETNALVIHAPPDVIRDLESVIRQIDIKRSQVMVNAIIAEISSERAAELGVQWLYDGSPDNAPVGVVKFGSALEGLLSTPPVVGDGVSLVLGDTGGSGSRLGALLRTLAGDGNTNILSTPTLVTLDNQEAEIVVGQNVPFVTGSYSSTGTGTSSSVTNPFQTIQRQDVGLKLKIKPQINEGSAIRLEIDQEVSSLTAGTKGAADLITNKRSFKTSVMVDDGEVLVIGGLIDDTLTENVQKVPILGDIPVLGWLFSYRSSKKVKRNLMAFIHPVIMRDNNQSMALSSEKYNQLRAEQLDIRKRGVELLPDDSSPLMPEMEQWKALPPPYYEVDKSSASTTEPPVVNDEPAQPPVQ